MSNKVALVTGGSKGIGFGIAEALLKNGYKVAITSRTIDAANNAAHNLVEFGDILAIEADVKDFNAQQAAVNLIIEKWGQIDVLIANAGVGSFAPIDELTVESWNEIIDTNLTGVFYSIKASVEAIKSSKGAIITISSLAGTNFFAGGSAYNASKFGLTGFTQSVMLDLRKFGVRVSTIMPGSVASHFNDHNPDSTDDAWKIQPEDMGKLVVDLLAMPSRTLPSKIEIRPTTPKG